MYIDCKADGTYCVMSDDRGEVNMVDGMELDLVGRRGEPIRCTWRDRFPGDPSLMMHFQKETGGTALIQIAMEAGMTVQYIGVRPSQR